MKDIELRLVSELMKNSRRSDRELAKALGVSQPTVSRTLTKLQKQGFIRGYTIIPDFAKLGYSLLAITFVKLKSAYTAEETEKIRKAVKDAIEQSQFGIVMLERGMGLKADACIISIYRDYSEYVLHREAMMAFPFIDMSRIETFIIDLKDNVRYRPLNFDVIAKQIAAKRKVK
jgi:DNA-binding Lrp family transcriptional regulator